MKRIFLSPPHVGERERELLLDAFDSNWIAPLGPHVDAFERELADWVGVGHAAAMSSGTAALHLALQTLGVGPGDEVFTSTLTFVATANAIRYVGAAPVFIDCDRATWNMDPDLLADALEQAARRGRLPKAVVVVDLYGQCADYDRILEVSTAHEVPVVEDAAEALGATYRGKAAGSLGTVGIFSFNGNKIITTSCGGMLVSDRKDLVENARFLSTQARDLGRPYHEHSHVGYNYRMSNLLAAIGRGQLHGLAERVSKRRQTNATYRRALESLPGIDFMPEAPYGRATFWLSCLTIDKTAFGASNEDVRRRLEAHEIESRPIWKPMHMQPAFSQFQSLRGDVAADLFEHGLCLPSGSALSDVECQRIIEIVAQTAQ